MSDSLALRAWGSARWSIIRRRLASLRAAPTLHDIRGVPGRCHALTGDRAGQLAMTISRNERLVFEPDHLPVPQLEDGGLDWNRVTRIRVIGLVDYHGA